MVVAQLMNTRIVSSVRASKAAPSASSVTAFTGFRSNKNMMTRGSSASLSAAVYGRVASIQVYYDGKSTFIYHRLTDLNI